MSISGINSLNLYGQSLLGTGTQQGYNSLAYPSIFGSSSLGTSGTSSDLSNMFSSLLGTSAQQTGTLDSATIQKAIDTNGNGLIEQNEILAFLADPATVLQKAGIGKTEDSTQSILSLLTQLLSGNKNTEKATQANSSAISQLQQQLQAATAKSNELQNQVSAQAAKVETATQKAEQAANDAKAAIAKANESAKALTNYKNSHGDEDPKLFAKEFGQLLDANKDNAISREEFTKISEAAGEDLKLNKAEWDSLVDASALADANKADLKAQVAENDEIDAKGLEDQLFENDKDGDGKVEAGDEINSFATDVAGNDSDAAAVNTGDLAAESFEITPEE